MKKIKSRAIFALLLVALAITGIFIYIILFAVKGGEWASAAFNSAVYRSGALAAGTLTDRRGTALSSIADGRRVFAGDAATRRATLHAVGDLQGNIGTGALSVYAPELIGYNFFTGVYSRSGAGRTVALTIDARLNTAAYNALDGRRGAVMVCNYKTGEVLCMVSNPSFDPLSPPDDINENPAYEGAYINRAISAAYTPGSTYKLLTAAAAIENIDGIFMRSFLCEGSLTTSDGSVTCSRTHGTLDFEGALTVSCNSVFGGLALELGADLLASYAQKYGLSGRTSVGGVNTAQGGFTLAGAGTADLAWSGIGQFNNAVCPAVMLRFVGAIANDGIAADFSLLRERGVSGLFGGGSKRVMKADTARLVGSMMDYNVHQTNVTGYFPGLELHAKSGTAEVGGGLDPHAWFIGYITNEGFPLAFVVVVENGGGGFAVASPIANRVLQAALDGGLE